jgi:hypothetical protein
VAELEDFGNSAGLDLLAMGSTTTTKRACTKRVGAPEMMDTDETDSTKMATVTAAGEAAAKEWLAAFAALPLASLGEEELKVHLEKLRAEVEANPTLRDALNSTSV